MACENIVKSGTIGIFCKMFDYDRLVLLSIVCVFHYFLWSATSCIRMWQGRECHRSDFDDHFFKGVSKERSSLPLKQTMQGEVILALTEFKTVPSHAKIRLASHHTIWTAPLNVVASNIYYSHLLLFFYLKDKNSTQTAMELQKEVRILCGLHKNQHLY